MVESASRRLPRLTGINNYKFVRLINRGKFGEVYRAVNSLTQEIVAVKVISKNSPMSKASLERELDISQRAKHPALIATREVIEDTDGRVYIVQELADGGDLYDYLMKSGACRAEEEHSLKEVFTQVASGLDYLHNELHVVHRDVKLENITIVTNVGNDNFPSVRLLDFGLVEPIAEDGRQYIAPGVAGTAMYIAPEVVALKHQGGYIENPAKQDSFALGVLLYSLVTGNFPWGEASNSDPDYVDFSTRLSKGDYEAIFGVDPLKLGYTMHLANLLQGLLSPVPELRLTPGQAIDAFIDKAWFMPTISSVPIHTLPVLDAEEMMATGTLAVIS